MNCARDPLRPHSVWEKQERKTRKRRQHMVRRKRNPERSNKEQIKDVPDLSSGKGTTPLRDVTPCSKRWATLTNLNILWLTCYHLWSSLIISFMFFPRELTVLTQARFFWSRIILLQVEWVYLSISKLICETNEKSE